MQLHELAPLLRRQKEKRVGRGGKRGKTSGRGEKGQGARAGHRIRPAERDLIQRLPKLRGIKHSRLSLRAVVVTLENIERMKGNDVTPAALAAQGFIMHAKDKVKILGGGKMTRAVTVKGVPVSASAKKAIEAAGGKVE
ncbi:MAG: 50S ribosomal protein L15 [Candidatus Brennerbacteria bacterium]